MKGTYSRLFSVFCLVFLVGLAGCKSEEPAETPTQRVERAAESSGQAIEKAGEAVADSAERAGEYMSDTAITGRIKAAILRDPLLKMSQVEVTTTNNVVRLSGTVDSQASINRAVEIAHSLKDVKSVDSSLVY
ncbi:MAG: BON domain-containing protein [Desulfopila sp.]